MVQINPAVAWSSSYWSKDTHEDIVNCNYNALPSEIQKHINLNRLVWGSYYPDSWFPPMKGHCYPKALDRAKENLEKGKNYYKKGNYYDASFYFGKASHYIADSLCAPHCAFFKYNTVIRKHHNKYEKMGNSLKPAIIQNFNATSFTLDDIIIEGQKTGVKQWNTWLKTTDNNEKRAIIQENLNYATTISYYAILKTIKET